MWAAASGLDTGLVLLVGRGANLHAKDASGHTALDWAREHHRLSSAEWLEKSQTAVDVELLKGAKDGDLAAIRGALSKGADLDRRSAEAMTLAIAGGKGEVIDLLLSSGNDANVSIDEKSTPLMLAAATTSSDTILKILLSRGADVNRSDAKGYTPLAFAITGGKSSNAMLLIESGADLTRKTLDGSTTLLMAVRKGDIEVVRLLLQKGADVHIAAPNGATLVELAGDNSDLVTLLRRAGAR